MYYLEEEKDEALEKTAAVAVRPTKPTIYVPLLVKMFQKRILLILQYTYLKSCSEDVMLKDLIFHTG